VILEKNEKIFIDKIVLHSLVETYTSGRDYAMLSAKTSSLFINVPQPQSIVGLIPSTATVNHQTSASQSTAAAIGIPPPRLAGPGVTVHRVGGTSTLQRRPCPPPPPPSFAPPVSSAPSGTGYQPQHLQTAPRGRHHGLQELPCGFVGGSSSVSARNGTASTLGGALVTGNGLVPPSFQTAPTVGRPVSETAKVVEFPRENLRFVEKIGDGLFGEVSSCCVRSE